MEEQYDDPYEQQLLAVFESCLGDGEKELRVNGLGKLCEKLQLNEGGKEMILEFLGPSRRSISFGAFRDGLLELLDQSRQSDATTNQADEVDDLANHVLEAPNNSYMAKSKFSQKQLREYINDRILDEPKLSNSTSNGVNGTQVFPKYCYTQISSVPRKENSVGEPLSCAWSGNSQSDVIKSEIGKMNAAILGPQRTGFLLHDTLVDMWELAGIQDASGLLSDLGYDVSQVNLSDLMSSLLEEAKNHVVEPRDRVTSTHVKLLKCALCLFQEETRQLNALMEHLRNERDKLRNDVVEANERANVLAQEIDEHHSRMEKCRQEQLKQLESKHVEITKQLLSQLNAEREKHGNAVKVLDKQLQLSQLEEQRIKSELSSMSRETQELETENQILSNQVSKLKSFNDQLTLQVERLSAHREEVESTDVAENEEIADLMEHVKHLKLEIAMLRDHNDELTMELEEMKSREKESKIIKESLSNFASTKLSSNVSKNENGSFHEMETIETTNCSEPMICKLINDNPESENPKLTEIRNMVLETVQALKTLTKEDNCSENCAFKTELPRIFTNLETVVPRCWKEGEKCTNNLAKESDVECEERVSESFRDLVIQKTQKVENESKSGNNRGLRDYPPRKEEQTWKSSERCDELKSLLETLSENESGNVDVKVVEEVFQRQQVAHASEKKQALDRCLELEKSLDLMKSEYEKCEDYWSAKLEEERELFEQEQRISDDKLAELINKMAEYEEQFDIGDKGRHEETLAPIEEKVNLEDQYTDLEEEFEKYRVQAEKEMSSKEEELEKLREWLEKKRSLHDVASQFPEESAAAQSLDSSTPFSYRSLESASTFEIGSVPNSLEYSQELGNNVSLEATGKNNRLQVASSSSGCVQHVSADISFDDVRWLIQKKADIGFECKALQKEREKLRHDVARLQNLKQFCTFSAMPRNQFVDVGIVQNLYVKLHVQERKQKELMMCIRKQQQDTARLLQQTWKQHLNEVTDLKVIIHNCKIQLEKQFETNKNQAEKLSRADVLSRDLFVENTHLMDNMKRLEQHCHILSQCDNECTSV